MSRQSADLEQSSSQSFSITDAAQTGLQPSGDFSVGGWVKLESNPSGGLNDFSFVAKYDTSAGKREYTFVYVWNSGSPELWVIISSGGSTSTTIQKISQTLTLNEWVHVAFSYDLSAGQVEMFVDGASIGTVSGGQTSVFNSDTPFYLGGRGANNNTYLDGKMAYWRYFSAGLTAAEWTTEMNSATAVRANCEGDWDLDGDATDASGNGNNLTNNNLTPFVNDNPLTDISLYGDVEGTDYVKMTINSSEVDATLTDYPAYLDLSQIDSADNFWSTVGSTGADIIVTNSDGTVQYPLEVVEIDTTGKTGQAHFKIDSLSSSVNTDVRVYYDGSETARDVDALYGRNEVWSDYASVMHSENLTDSTGNNTPSAVGGVTAGGGTGKIGGGTDFDGVNDYFLIASSGIVDSAQPFTFTAWAKPGVSALDDQAMISMSSSSSNTPLAYMDLDTSGNLRLDIRDDSTSLLVNRPTGTTYDDGVYRMFHGVRNSSSPFSELFVNGSSVNTVTSNGATGTTTYTNTTVGARLTASVGNEMNGDLDEIRIRANAMSSTWISTEYNNQSAPATFWTYNAPPVVDTFIPRAIIF